MQEKEAAERKKMVELSRKSNFNIGEESRKKSENYAQETSSNVAYQYKLGQKSTSDVSKTDFKMANFKFGNQILKYVTTNNDTYNDIGIKDRVPEKKGKNEKQD